MSRPEFLEMYEESAFVEFKTGVGTKTVAESAVALANQGAPAVSVGGVNVA
jgi:hypothetical protein